MDERELRDRANELHDYLVGADERERAAQKRHDELVKVTEQGFEKLNKTLERGLRDLIEAVRAHNR